MNERKRDADSDLPTPTGLRNKARGRVVREHTPGMGCRLIQPLRGCAISKLRRPAQDQGGWKSLKAGPTDLTGRLAELILETFH